MKPRVAFLPAAAVAALVATAAILSACQQQPASQSTGSEPLSDADRAAVTALFDSTVASIRARDFDGWAARFTEDAVFLPPNHPVLRGRAALRAWADSNPPITEFAFPDVRVDGAGDVAYGTSAITLTLAPPGASPIKDTAKQLVVFRRQPDGRWRVVAAAFNSDLPMGPPPPPGKAAPKQD